jgi:hypothetical protein
VRDARLTLDRTKEGVLGRTEGVKRDCDYLHKKYLKIKTRGGGYEDS